MSKHLFGLIITPYGTAANNRGETEGNITTLQKILWKGEVHTTVSAEAIRWAIRYYWQLKGLSVNRKWDELTDEHRWADASWLPWTDPEGEGKEKDTYIDDDVLGFMLAEAAKVDGSDTSSDEEAEEESDKGKNAKGKSSRKKDQQRGKNKKGTCDKRRGALEVTRAISLTPFTGDITFNAKSGIKGNTSLYGTEMHATRYQYGFALTPGSLRKPERACCVVDAAVSLCEVGGNQSRFLYDFSPDAVIFRWTDDFAPRMLYGFSLDNVDNGLLTLPHIIDRIEAGDIDPAELVIGVSSSAIFASGTIEALTEKGVKSMGVKAAAKEVTERMARELLPKEEA